MSLSPADLSMLVVYVGLVLFFPVWLYLAGLVYHFIVTDTARLQIQKRGRE